MPNATPGSTHPNLHRAGESDVPMHVLRTLMLAIVLLLSTPVWADYRNYTDGVKALERGDFARAEPLLRNALNQNSEPRDRVKLYGSVFRPYLPQYYLAVALAGLNRCPEALTLLNDPTYRALLGNERVTKEANQDAAVRKKCATPVASAPGSTSAAATSTAATSTATQPTATGATGGPGTTAASTPSVAQTSSPAGNQAATPSSPQPVAASAPDAATLANAERAMVGLRALANRQGANAVPDLTQRVNLASAAIQRARDAKATDQLKRETAAAQALISQLEREIQQAVVAAKAVTPSPPAPAETREAPPLLRKAAEVFHNGDYAGVLSLNANSLSGADQGFLRLLQSAASYYLYESGDGSQLQRARSERDAARRLYRKEPSERFFSPRFRKFWRES